MTIRKSYNSPGLNRPFKDLKSLLKRKTEKLAEDTGHLDIKYDHKTKRKQPDKTDNLLSAEAEKRLFMEAMADVKPISRREKISHEKSNMPVTSINNDTEQKALLRLNNLVKFGEGFVVSHTSEYVEGTGYNVNPELTKRLHKGDFSIQNHIDLHGLSVQEAKTAFDIFLKESIITGKKGVLIVHGRGLSSPGIPVLKTMVIKWLTSSNWRKWVIAFSSARLCDGGTGATYVLLRNRPFTHRHRKRKQLKFLTLV